MTLPRLMVAAPASGHGKTTVATGLMAALARAGHTVSGHNVGPDYIDPGYHALATGRPGRNLDPHLVGEERLVPLLLHGAAGADLAVIEGVMGLYDGQIGGDGFASTAHVAAVTRTPVVLVVDISSASRTIAATIHGLRTWAPDPGRPPVDVVGVVLNKAGSSRHADEVVDAAGRIDIVLNAVGFDHVQGLPIAATSLEDFLHPLVGYLQTNFVTAKAASRHMIAQGSGVILTVSTPGARLTGRGLIGNAAQSAALEGFSRALAGELGPAGVRVVCVRPHAMSDALATSYTREMFGRTADAGGISRDEFLGALVGMTLLGRLPVLDEIAEYLAMHGLCVRAGEMCAGRKAGSGWVRASFHLYNTPAEVKELFRLLDGLVMRA